MRDLIRSTTVILVLFLSACSSIKKTTGNANVNSISKLVFLSEYDLPFGMKFKNTMVGGLSGIDYNKTKDEYYMIS
ncbi:MAG: PEP-CTERM sorting domain-containing protein, partial [Bacteroidota bacterium]